MSRFRPAARAAGLLAAAVQAGAVLADPLRSVRGRLAARPVLDCPAEVDVGEREDGEIVTARFAVANRGGGELHLTDFRTSCACAGVEQEVDGQPVRVDELRLAAGAAAGLQVRQSVRGDPGRPVRTPVYFRTTDPTRPEWQVVVTVPAVRGSVVAVPAAVVFGTVQVGATARQVIEVRDNAPTPRAISAATVSSSRLAANLLLPTSADPGYGVVVARVEVTADTSKPGSLDGEVAVTVAEASRPPLVVAVSGRVAAAYELSPPAVVLPVRTEAGPRYTAAVLVRSTSGRPARLAVTGLPPGVTADIEPAGPAVWRVVLVADPKAGGGTVRLTAHDTALDLPVTVLPAADR